MRGEGGGGEGEGEGNREGGGEAGDEVFTEAATLQSRHHSIMRASGQYYTIPISMLEYSTCTCTCT